MHRISQSWYVPHKNRISKLSTRNQHGRPLVVGLATMIPDHSFKIISMLA
ncbi:MAG: hypothetical protein AVDCRST_MAG93-8284 [uncultured Chloroflexia bacterium]|uniref:Uncharacterized protein n=1 Tax=uncultured Chloroflexia bacterium TaxID=1672391 RepID=A0A6J4MUV9_9CHLR|nr:MAG: hypothetical protein AVDCRST_MAG93-8284 [uncultured Chloroflexia bacterium]